MTGARAPSAGLVDALAGLGGPIVRTAEVAVSEQAIRTWCAAIGEDNPIYRDAEAAARAGHGGVFAPPPLLQTWTIPIGQDLAEHPPTLHSRVRRAASDCGFDAVVATDYEHDNLGYVRPGDLLTERSRIDSVSDRKQTTLGEGHFVTIGFELANQDGTPVGRVRARTLYFRPSPHGPTRPDPPGGLGQYRQTPSGNADQGSNQWPRLDVPITRTLVVGASLAARDSEPVHHNRLVAREQGLPDIITGIVTTAGLVNRYAGCNLPRSAVARRLSLRLASPAVPGDVLALRGGWTSERQVHVVGHHDRGMHVEARIEFRHAMKE